jgi:hypothetical protein
MNPELTTLELDAASLACLVNICTKKGLTPSQVVSEVIRENAVREGLLKATA